MAGRLMGALSSARFAARRGPVAASAASAASAARALSGAPSARARPAAASAVAAATATVRPSSTKTIRRNLHGTAAKAALVQFNLADVGEGIVDCSIVRWHVKVGDTVKEFDYICEVQSDKANVEISSRYSGVVRKLYYQAGENAKVGRPLVDIETADGATTPAAAAAAAAGSGAIADGAAAGARAGSAGASAAPSAASTAQDEDRLTFATPAVRRLAKENKLDLRAVVGTGRDGRILKEDVLRFLEGAAAAPASASAPPPPSAASAPASPPPPPRTAAAPALADRREPVRGFTKAMIKAMNHSWKTIPHFGYCDEVDMGAVARLRQDLKASAEKQGVRLSYMPILIKAASLALRDFPILNSSLSPDEAEIVYKAAHNIGLAMDTPNGLVVPNIKDVQDKSIFEIAADLNALQQKGAAGKLGPADLVGGTFTLSNIGTIGGTYMKPVIVAPEVCIGAVGKIERLPRFDAAGQVYAAQIMAVSWSADHRLIDGATMARFSNRWKGYLEAPTTMLLQLK